MSHTTLARELSIFIRRGNKKGSKLINGDILPFNTQVQSYSRKVLKQFVTEFTDFINVGVLATYQFEHFSH